MSRRCECTYLAMITTSGCRPIAVGDATLRVLLRFEKRNRLEVLLLNEGYAMLIPVS